MKEKYVLEFFIFWFLLGIGEYLFFRLNKNAPLKRKLFPVSIISTYIILILFMWFVSDFNLHWFFLLMVPWMAFIAFLNIKKVNFCDNCGSTIYNKKIFSAEKQCSQCGEEL